MSEVASSCWSCRTWIPGNEQADALVYPEETSLSGVVQVDIAPPGFERLTVGA